MSYVVDWQRLDRDGLLVVTLYGQGDAATLMDLMDELEAAAMGGPLRILLDESSLQPGFITATDIRHIASWWRETRGLGRSRVGIVAPSDVMFGLNRMVQLGADLSCETQLRVFRDLDEAVNWLRG